VGSWKSPGFFLTKRVGTLFIQVLARGLIKGDEHPASTPHGIWQSSAILDVYLSLIFAIFKIHI